MFVCLFVPQVLFVECGYKFRFFGRDAEVAAKHLKIMLIQREGEPFLTASIPVQRLYFHVDRLVGLGYKVGVVHQTESAAFREANSSKPFERKLTKMFTRATFIPVTDCHVLICAQASVFNPSQTLAAESPSSSSKYWLANQSPNHPLLQVQTSFF